MSLHEENDYRLLSDFNVEEEVEDLPKKRKIKRLLEDKLERKRLKDEFKDELDELTGEFDWDDLDK